MLHQYSMLPNITPLYFFRSNIKCFVQKKPIKVQIFETFRCSGKNFPNSLCHFWKQKSVFLQILHQYSVLPNITPLYFFRSNIIYFVQKKPIKVQIFEIFECSGQNSSNSSCQFWTDKSIPVQIWYHSSLSWHKTPL